MYIYTLPYCGYLTKSFFIKKCPIGTPFVSDRETLLASVVGDASMRFTDSYLWYFNTVGSSWFPMGGGVGGVWCGGVWCGGVWCERVAWEGKSCRCGGGGGRKMKEGEKEEERQRGR